MRAAAALVVLVAVGCGSSDPAEVPAHFPAGEIDRVEEHYGLTVFVDDDDRWLYVEADDPEGCERAFDLVGGSDDAPFLDGGYQYECTYVPGQ